MTQDIQQKLTDSEALSVDEQRIFIQEMLNKVAQMKESNPEKYLELLTSLNTTLANLNSELIAAMKGF